MRIPIISGHSVSQPGAIAYDGTTEHSLNVELQSMIVSGYKHSVALSGSSMKPITDNEELCLRSVINLINAIRGAAYGLDIHFNNNNPSATGVEAFVHPNTQANNRSRASFMVEGLSEIMEIRNRGVKPPSESGLGSLAIIEQTNIPMILIEICFLNSADLPKYRKTQADVAKFISDLMFNATVFLS